MTTSQAPVTSTTATSHLIDDTGTVLDGVQRDDVASRLRDGVFFWLDLPGLGDEELGWLRDLFGFHPLAIEDAEQFGERPKLEEYPDYTFMVLFGSSLNLGSSFTGAGAHDAPQTSPTSLDDLSEVHFFVSGQYMVTVHRATCPALHDLAARMKKAGVAVKDPARLFHRVADTLVDSFFPVLNDLDEGLDLLQGQIVARPDNAQLARLLDYRSSLIGLRKVVAPQRDIFAGLASGVTELAGLDDEAQRYFRDIYDHLIRLAELIDGYRDLVSGTTDAYLSVVSNQLNVIMKQLTIISTVFLPLSFLTGFFGQNFGALVNHIGSWETFLALGIGSEVVAVGGLYTLFKRRGWLAAAT
jgi:magnesium transporter